MGKLVCDVMSSAVKLSVPLKVDTRSGRNWGEVK
jgi:DNA polymerase I-like protein with 3'-5' exonuclease and polymerase domains